MELDNIHSVLCNEVRPASSHIFSYELSTLHMWTESNMSTVSNHNVDGSNLYISLTYGSNRSLAMQVYPLTSLLGLYVQNVLNVRVQESLG